MIIVLPLPHRSLHPNCRTHWAAKARQVKIARERAKRECFKILKELEGPLLVLGYVLHPYYKNLRVRDDTNLVAAFKAQEDGIADAFCQDDGSWRCRGVVPHLDRENPRLEVELITEDLS